MRSLPLRHSLAIAMSALAAAGVFLAVAIAAREVSLLNRMAAEERLAFVADRLEDLASQAAEQREALKRATAGQPAVVAALRDGLVDGEALRAALAPLRTPADSGLAIQLWSRTGAVVFSDVPAQHAAQRAPGPAPRRYIPLDTVPAYGSFHEADGAMSYYGTAPVVSDGAIIGWIVQHRRSGSRQAAAQLEPLIGQDARVLFHYPGDSLWITLAGEAVRAPIELLPWDTTVEITTDGATTLVRAHQVRAAPWSVLVEMPADLVGGDTGRFMLRTLLGGLGLLAAAVLVALLLCGRLTRGLRHLADAADRLARGDYSARVNADVGGEEMARLAAAFNTMAEQVATSHAELQQRLAESRTLMEDLSAAHRRAEAARAQAEAADRAKSDFLATMSHEIRTPINAVLGFCQVLELEDLSEERRREYLQRAQRAARQLASLVDDVLDLSKIQSGVMAIDPSPTPVRPAIDAVCIMLSESTRRKALAVTVDVEQDTVVHADPQLLQQILLNLMSNAVKFTPDGGRIAISAGVRFDNGTAPAVHVNVDDSGIGVPADQLERIFEPFVQADSSYTREFGGTGLGLTISRRLARLMGGDVVAASSEGAGSRFTLLLPSATVHSGS